MKWTDAVKFMKDGEKVTRATWQGHYLRWDGAQYLQGKSTTTFEESADNIAQGRGDYADGWLLFIAPKKA